MGRKRWVVGRAEKLYEVTLGGGDACNYDALGYFPPAPSLP
jgi:hypothetical protein